MTYFRNLNNINVIDAYFSYVIYIYVYDCDAPWRLYMTVRHCHEKKSNSRWKIRNFFPDLAWPEKIYIFFRNIPMMNSHWSSKWGASRADHFIRMYNFFLDVYNTSRIYCFLSKNQNTIEANKFRWNAELWQTKFVQSFYYKLTKNKIFWDLKSKNCKQMSHNGLPLGIKMTGSSTWLFYTDVQYHLSIYFCVHLRPLFPLLML